jgi:hypothetical protein
MGTELLVEHLQDGKSLIRQLARDGYEVAVAFWAKFEDDALWQLHIASPESERATMPKALRTVYAALDKLPDIRITPAEITLLGSSDRVACDAMALRDRHPVTNAKRFQDMRLGNRIFADLFVYPKPMPWEIREADGRWDVQISEDGGVWLACDSKEDAQAIAAWPVLEAEAREQVRFGEAFASQLERTAKVMSKYRLDTGSRYFRNYAQDARSQQRSDQEIPV